MSSIEVKPRNEAASDRFHKLPKRVQDELLNISVHVTVALDEMSFSCLPELSEDGKPTIGCPDPRRVLQQLLKARQALERLTGQARRSTIHGWDWPEAK